MLEDLGLTYNKNKITNMSVSNGQSYILLSKTILDIHIERIWYDSSEQIRSKHTLSHE